MISEDALSRACRPAILGRARMIAQREGRIAERLCTYEGGLTHLTACIDSASGYATSYDTSITLDEESDQVFSYDCSCPAARRFSGPCKHSIALAMDFNRNAELYEGFSQLQHVTTSAAIAAFLDRTRPAVQPRVARDGGEPAASVRLQPRLLRDNGLFLGLRVVGSRGAYVVRDLGEFEQRVSEGVYAEYGRKLGFTHGMDAFVGEDRALVRFVCRCVQNRRSWSGTRIYGHVFTTSGAAGQVGKELRLSPPEIDELLELLLGRTVSFEQPGAGARPAQQSEVAVVNGDPKVGLDITSAGDGAYRLERNGELEVFSTAERVYALQGGRLYRCSERMRSAAPFLQQVYCSQADELLVAEQDASRLVGQVLPQIEGALEVRVAPELDALRPEPLRLLFLLDCSGKLVTCDALACYGVRTVRLFDRPSADDALVRDGVAEADARMVVNRYFTTARTDEGLLVSRLDTASVARIVYEGVRELERIGEVRASEAFGRLARRERPRVQVRVRAEHGSGLIDLEVHASDLPASELYALLASYRQRERYHRLRDGSIVDLAEADLSEAARLADELGLSAADLTAGQVRVPSYKAFLVDALLTDEEKDASFMATLDDFRTVDADAYDPPASLAPRLRPYQVAGFRWLSCLMDMGFGGILADEMGLGKSVQVISLLLARRGRGQTLVVCPASLVYNWIAEFEKFAPELDVAAVAGTAAERQRIREERGHEVLVTSYDLLRRDVERYASSQLWCVVLDEAQYVKNRQTLAARAVKALRARHRFALTGTPVENRLSELWSIFDFLMPGLLGGYERFRERYELPIAEGDHVAATTLRLATAPFVLRRLKSQVLSDLPEKLEQVVTCRMGQTQRGLYAAREQALRESIAGGGTDVSRERIAVLAELTRLRQLCCDPRLIYEDYDGGSAKLDTIWQLVMRAMDARAKVLVFSQFTSFLSLIAERLDHEGVGYYTITGATPKERRVELVDAFNADDTPVFLVSLRAGGTGLNLVGASVVVHADPWWNVAVQDQATDRAHRIGQTRDVTVYKVVCGQSIEERILALQERKASLAEEFVAGGAGAQSLAALTRDDLLGLLGD